MSDIGYRCPDVDLDLRLGIGIPACSPLLFTHSVVVVGCQCWLSVLRCRLTGQQAEAKENRLTGHQMISRTSPTSLTLTTNPQTVPISSDQRPADQPATHSINHGQPNWTMASSGDLHNS